MLEVEYDKIPSLMHLRNEGMRKKNDIDRKKGDECDNPWIGENEKIVYIRTLVYAYLLYTCR